MYGSDRWQFGPGGSLVLPQAPVDCCVWLKKSLMRARPEAGEQLRLGRGSLQDAKIPFKYQGLDMILSYGRFLWIIDMPRIYTTGG